MNRKLKALGLALIACLLLGVIGASAQAAEFHSEAEHTILEGGQTTTHEFTAGSGFGSIKCATAKFHGTTNAKTTKEVTITPTYSNCKDSLGRTVHVDMNSCDYNFTAPTVGVTEGTVHILCEKANDSITLTVTNASGSAVCTVHIGPQTLPVTYHTEVTPKGKHAILVTVHITTIQSTVTGGFFNCGLAGEHQTAGTYKGSTLMEGFNTATEPVHITVE